MLVGFRYCYIILLHSLRVFQALHVSNVPLETPSKVYLKRFMQNVVNDI